MKEQVDNGMMVAALKHELLFMPDEYELVKLHRKEPQTRNHHAVFLLTSVRGDRERKDEQQSCCEA